MTKITTFVVYRLKLYAKSMNIFVKATPSKKPRTEESQKIIYFYVAVLVILAVSQLFSFDKFLVLLESFALPGGSTTAYFIGSLLVTSEVLALPFLLRLEVSPLMRVTSMALGWLVPMIWIFLSLWLKLTSSTVSNIGFLGTVVHIIPGWWAVFISISILFLSIWASWGLWPGKRK